MKNRRMRLMAIFAAGVLSVTSMGGIVTAHAEETLAVPAEEAGAGAVQMDGEDVQAAEDGQCLYDMILVLIYYQFYHNIRSIKFV